MDSSHGASAVPVLWLSLSRQPPSLTSIGDSAFGACGNLTSVTGLEGVPSVHKEAFFNCSHLDQASRAAVEAAVARTAEAQAAA